MVVKETTICDRCNKVVAIGKCDICGVDCCDNCMGRVGLMLSYAEFSLTDFLICSNCSSKICRIEKGEPSQINEEIRKQIQEHLKNLIVLTELKQEELKELSEEEKERLLRNELVRQNSPSFYRSKNKYSKNKWNCSIMK